MVSHTVARYIVGIIGNVISFGLFLSPLPTLYEIMKKKTVEEYKPDPYLATVMNCMFWVFYGMPFIHPDSLLVITINGVGLVLESIYLVIFLLFTDSKGRKKIFICLLIEVIFVAVVVLITLLTLHGHKHRSLMVGIICDIFNIMMYFAPLTIIRKVIKTKSVKYMPFTLSLANFLNGCIWTTYALLKFDPYILASNSVGVASGLLQLFLYAYYSAKGSKEEENAKAKLSEIQMANGGAAYRV